MQELKTNKKKILFTLIIFGLLSINFTLVFNTQIKKQIYSLINPPFRTITSILISNINKERPIKIVKIQTNEGLFLEVYSANKTGMQSLLSKVKIQDPHDGYFQFATQSSNLALSDINRDGEINIVAVSFDKNQKGHLNIYNFNYETNDLVFLGRK